MRINSVWERCSKIIILILDVTLNYYFIKLMKERLPSFGLMKYAPLVQFNMRHIGHLDCHGRTYDSQRPQCTNALSTLG